MNTIMDFVKYKAVFWKIPLAAALAWEIAEWAGSKHPYLASLAVILTVQLTVHMSVQFAWKRVLGTTAGVILTTAIIPYVEVNGWSVGLLLLIGIFIIMWLRLDHSFMVQVALSIVLVMFFQSKMPSYPLDRIRDTVIGVIVALLIHVLIFPPDSINKTKGKMSRFTGHLSYHFIDTAHWVKNGCPPNEVEILLSQLQSLFQELHQATTELIEAEQSFRYRPFGRKQRLTLKQLAVDMQLLQSGYANLADMMRVLEQWSESGSFAQAKQQEWADHLYVLADVIKNWKTKLEDSTGYSPLSHVQALQIQTPIDSKNDLYPMALYMNAEQVIEDFQNSI